MDRIHRLVRSTFIKDVHDAVEVYQLTLTALVVIPDARAKEILEVCDDLLRHMAARFRQDPDNRDNKVTVAHFVEGTRHNDAEVREALRYVVETPGITAGSTGFPDGPDEFAFASEQSRLYDSVNSLASQLLEWAGASAAMPATLLGHESSESTRFDKIISAFKNNSILVWLFVLGLAITLLRNVVASVLDLFEWLRSWLG